MCSPVYCDTDTPPCNVAATLLDPPYDDDDDSDAVVVDNDDDGDAVVVENDDDGDAC